MVERKFITGTWVFSNSILDTFYHVDNNNLCLQCVLKPLKYLEKYERYKKMCRTKFPRYRGRCTVLLRYFTLRRSWNLWWRTVRKARIYFEKFWMSATKTCDKRRRSPFKNCNVDFTEDFKVTEKSNTQEYNMFLCVSCNFLFETLLFLYRNFFDYTSTLKLQIWYNINYKFSNPNLRCSYIAVIKNEYSSFHITRIRWFCKVTF